MFNMKRIIYYIITILLAGNCWSATAQQLSTKNKKALKAWQQAYEGFRNRDYNTTLLALEKAIKHDKKFIEAYYLKADILAEQDKNEEVILTLNQAKKIEKKPSTTTFYMLAKAKRNLGQYADASKLLQQYKLLVTTKKQKVAADFLIKTCEFGQQQISNPVEFHPINLGSAINSANDEYWPSLSADQKTLIFTRLVKERTRKQEDFFIALKNDSIWLPAQNMGPPTNSSYNEGAQSLSADGKTLVFTACRRQGGAGSCDLYISFRKNNKWTQPANMGYPINSRAWESQPSLSANGQTLYFVSNRAGGYGNKDIWVSHKKEGIWQTPVNLGKIINTPHNETAPFLHPDSQTLYFASDGHMGMGRSDIFLSRLKNEAWTSPLNLGYPINTQGEERGIITDTHGDYAFISSVRDGGFGGLDLYRFAVPDSAKPQPLTYVKGIVTDSETGVPLLAKVELIELETEKTTILYSSEDKGDFLLILPAGKSYALNVWRKNYLFYSDHFDLKKQHSKLAPFLLDIRLKPIQKNWSMILKNVFFDTDKYELKKESAAELKKLVSFLNSNPTVHLEIGGHTDNVGSAVHNKTLSSNRAKEVYKYLINKGINKERLTYKGYGQNKPIAKNKTSEGRKQNRRTEVKITSK